ncbi:PIN domain protein family protein [Terriglobus saanensis SP1PR4]|uniref:PIN domain protein family protein n=1 Tax=Terriglobus saanensis (strain ATCC BAA-1853 / DSM 23119 / SP1PR4) TaxID=401053 RepID=E8V2W8_TERSS|nr:PIN domain protein family protein [Terriglobus saanensis SP1PR4]
MRLSKAEYLLDVNVFVALLSEDHTHHQLVTAWFNTPSLLWAICPFTEAGFLRNATAPRPGQITMTEATAVLARMAQVPGYHYLPITADWRSLCSPFSTRLYGTKQVTDAYLLGLAVREDLVLVTMDKGILHLAGNEYSAHVLLLERK